MQRCINFDQNFFFQKSEIFFWGSQFHSSSYGTSMPPVSGRHRGWCFTLNNYTTDQCSALLQRVSQDGNKVVYLCFGKEVGDSGTPHLQGYVHFSRNVRLREAKNSLVGSPHLEGRRGTLEEAIEYCKKDGDFHEAGSLPPSAAQRGRMGGDAEIQRWDDAREAASRGEYDLVPSDIYIRHYSNIRRIGADHQPATSPQERCRGLWLFGEPGSGKSYWARAYNPGSTYIKLQSKWWDNYEKEEVVLIEDLDEVSIGNMKNHLKIWADKYEFRGEVKGAAMKINPKLLIVTSNFAIEDLFSERYLDAISRRFTQVKFSKEDGEFIREVISCSDDTPDWDSLN